MKFDRNTVLGFVILGALFVGYFIYTNKGQAEANKAAIAEQKRKQAIQDSIDLVNKPKQDSLNRIADSIAKVTNAGTFKTAFTNSLK